MRCPYCDEIAECRIIGGKLYRLTVFMCRHCNWGCARG